MICQVCDKLSHSAKKCYHRFDVTYHDNAATSSNLHSLMATTNAVSESNWHPDTGATHHLTNNMANLNLRSEDYTGIDQVLVGNGASLHISQIGSSILTPLKTPFVLKQLLIVPKIQKNLISVQQFCSDNVVYFEYHNRFFFSLRTTRGKSFIATPLKMVYIHSPACQTHSLLMHSLLYELLTKYGTIGLVMHPFQFFKNQFLHLRYLLQNKDFQFVQIVN